MKKEIFSLLIAFTFSLLPLSAQSKYEKTSWKQIATTKDRSWFASDEAKAIAENVLWYQRPIGGWPKNMPMHLPIGEETQKKESTAHKSFAPTLDNNATTVEMIFMARMYKSTGDERYKGSFLQGLNYIIRAQYPNGGWPQFYPFLKGYYTHITYNDNAMINILNLEQDIINRKSDYDFVPKDLLTTTQESFNKGIDCILNTQIVKNGKLSVWCAQHDEKTLLPTQARAYELPSFSGSESVGVIQLLMSLPNPSPEVIKAVDGAIQWFEEHKLTGIRQVFESDSSGVKNRIIIEDPNAPALWARFYDLESEKPFFCDRDGIKHSSLSDIGQERRNGYSWYGTWAEKILKAYPQWRSKVSK